MRAISHSPADGSSASSIFDSSSRIRSALMISSRSRICSIAPHELGVGLEAERRDEPRRPQHAQRVVAERDLGRERRAQPPGREIDETVVRIERARARPSAIAIALIVKSRRERSVSMSSENVTVGLAAVGAVDLGAERRDLEAVAVLLAADGAEALTLQPYRVGPALHDPLDRRRAGRRSRCRCRSRGGRGRGTRRARCRRPDTHGDRPRAGAATAAAMAESGSKNRARRGGTAVTAVHSGGWALQPLCSPS